MPTDQWIRCKACGQEFLFSAGEQEFFRERKITPPKSCRNCRATRRAADDLLGQRITDAQATGLKSTGVIESYNSDRGFGFLLPDGGSEAIFFHVRSLYQSKPRQITVGAAVEFIEIESVRKPGVRCAEKVRVLDAPEGATS
jgi:cold shock CspA family protein